MLMKICIKVSYNDQLRYICCDADYTYEDICALTFRRFNISRKYQKYMLFSSDNNFIFDKTSFECYLSLFPMPKIIFHLRYLKEFVKMAKQSDYNSERTPLGYSALNNQLQTNENNVQPVAVYRQNCFIGLFPSNTRSGSVEEGEMSPPKPSYKRSYSSYGYGETHEVKNKKHKMSIRF